jgi:hypothetical protein
MSPFRTATFWLLLLPSAFTFALPGVIFGNEQAFEKWAPIILPLQALVTVAAPYALVRRTLVSRGKRVSGFPVGQNPDANRRAE